jgi:hypothetical protein
MKRNKFALIVIGSLLFPLSFAHARGGDGPRGGPDFDEPQPHFYKEMPSGYKTVVVAGITYFVLDNLWYLMHGNKYEQVATPTNVTVINNPPPVVQTTTNASMNVVDVNGIRYYVSAGHYFRREISGQLLEVTPPL